MCRSEGEKLCRVTVPVFGSVPIFGRVAKNVKFGTNATIYMSDEVVLAFIDCVFRHEAVWNRQHPDYQNIHHRNDEWNDIAAEMDQPIDELKEKWASLQSIYRKYRSKLNRSMVTGSGMS
ncbi:uncharacterized protein LOC121592026 isoform X3 [Anopheles merus]|uniref:uncharacterized protein LOC121592026 isoform X3 n=1 Tax=Anopheles merus TaxID=30066 RepID=UPI001BE41640|nr:uncharacterized protein LOC121592026 isoform X3 [Anopheles merus]